MTTFSVLNEGHPLVKHFFLYQKIWIKHMLHGSGRDYTLHCVTASASKTHTHTHTHTHSHICRRQKVQKVTYVFTTAQVQRKLSVRWNNLSQIFSSLKMPWQNSVHKRGLFYRKRHNNYILSNSIIYLLYTLFHYPAF